MPEAAEGWPWCPSPDVRSWVSVAPQVPSRSIMERMQQSTTPRARRPLIRLLVAVVLLAPIVFVALTYFWFIAPPTEDVETVTAGDAVVVFAGSRDRLLTAVELMERGVASNLVIPNGRTSEMNRPGFCDETAFRVFCPETETIDTRGEARAIGQLAEEMGWTSLIAVTSVYHVHRATSQLRRCHEGPVVAVAASQSMDGDDWLDKVVHEWAGTLAAMTIRSAC